MPPTLAQLPPPPPGKTGWPWTEDSLRPAPPSTSEAAWPRITLVTPSFNQAPFLEEALRSVLLQGYPNLEYFILDGGSTDGSVDIIHRYAPWLSWWVSEPDGGQTAALNKGFARASGAILGYLNSDDVLLPGALGQAAEGFAQHPAAVVVYGDAELIEIDGSRRGRAPQIRACDRDYLLNEDNAIGQPAAFFKRAEFEAVGALVNDLYYVMDYDLWLKLSARGEMVYLPQPMACMRLYPNAKSGRGDCDMFTEIQGIVERQGGHGLPTKIAAWLEAVTLPRAMEALRQNQMAAGQADLACILAHIPTWRSTDRLAQTIAGEAWRRMDSNEVAAPAGLAWAAGICRGLPRQWINPVEVEQKTLGRLYEALALHSYRQGQYDAVGRYAWRASRHDPSRLGNRGLWSVTLRSLLRRSASPPL